MFKLLNCVHKVKEVVAKKLCKTSNNTNSDSSSISNTTFSAKIKFSRLFGKAEIILGRTTVDSQVSADMKRVDQETTSVSDTSFPAKFQFSRLLGKAKITLGRTIVDSQTSDDIERVDQQVHCVSNTFFPAKFKLSRLFGKTEITLGCAISDSQVSSDIERAYQEVHLVASTFYPVRIQFSRLFGKAEIILGSTTADSQASTDMSKVNQKVTPVSKDISPIVSSLCSNTSVVHSPNTSSTDKQTDNTLFNTIPPKNIFSKDNVSISQTPNASTSTNHKQRLSYTDMNPDHPKALSSELDINRVPSNITCAPVLQFIELQSSSILPNPYSIAQNQPTEYYVPIKHTSLKSPSLLSKIINLDTKHPIAVNSLTTAYGTFI